MKQGYKVTLLIFLVLLADQISKVYIKTHFEYNEEILMFGQEWARLHFVENEGMAFGITFDWEYGKLVLSLFRIGMVAGLIWYMRQLMLVRAASGFVYSVGLITAGAIGNIIDSAFYGLIFTASGHHTEGLAQLTPIGQGYGSFLHGKVVDMFYFPMKWINVPEWVPGIGGEQFLFFSPIFNVADAAITVGVVTILIFQRRFFREETPLTTAPVVAETETLPTENMTETELIAEAVLPGETDAENTESTNEGRDENAEKINPEV
jgi:signal peptidase II